MFPGPRPAATTLWLDRFPSTAEEREDLYLIHPQQAGVSVKIRGSSLLELKLQQEDSRILDIAGFATAGMKTCEKWSFRLAAAGGTAPAGGSWKQVRKNRRLSRFGQGGRPTGPGTADGEHAACEAELTDIRIDGQDWWTLGLEAFGSDTRAWDFLQAAAAALFADPLPADVPPGSSSAITYSEWLQSRHYALR